MAFGAADFQDQCQNPAPVLLWVSGAGWRARAVGRNVGLQLCFHSIPEKGVEKSLSYSAVGAGLCGLSELKHSFGLEII